MNVVISSAPTSPFIPIGAQIYRRDIDGDKDGNGDGKGGIYTIGANDFNTRTNPGNANTLLGIEALDRPADNGFIFADTGDANGGGPAATKLRGQLPIADPRGFYCTNTAAGK